METVDLLISGDWVLTLDPNLGTLEGGAVAVSGERIKDVGERLRLESLYRPRRRIHAAGSVVLPGLINAHTHAAMTLFRGLADDLPLMDWLQDYIFPVEAHLRAEWVRWGTRLACAEMLMGGITTFCDMYLFEEEVASAAKEAGMRAVVGEVLYDFPSPNYGPLEEGFRYTEALIRKWKGDSLIQPAVEPHAPFTCSPELLQRARRVADENQVPLIIHLSETRDEVERVRDEHGTTPIRHLHRLGTLEGPTVAAHVVWADDEELELLRESGVGVVHNPESNMKLASGVSPVPRMLEMGIPVGLGTDGCASNNNLDLFGEMDTAAKLHKVHSQDPTVLDAQTVLKMATALGAKALGMEEEIGTLTPGKRADLIIVGLEAPHLLPLFHVTSHLVYSARASDVKTVLVNGRVVVEEGRILTLDLEAVLNAAEGIAREIQQILRKNTGSPEVSP